MTQPAISMIVARSRNHVIGRDNQMPWKISADLQFFKRVTMGHPVIMGRKTWESIGRPLPGRRNIVVSRNASYQATGGELVGSLDEALKSLSEFPRVFVIGGEQLFTQAFPKADRLYITEIDMDIEGGDTFFEVPNESDWKEVERTPGSEGDVNFSFITLERK
ncbi:dihydrofolate reductase [Polynucleobacter sp. Tro8-14-1]|jgi:dihydrofolate reductase|uniref:dihydrofolate reductase n=1 Tax=Polynucleobacter sp. Tro8-14-1 TaxID=1758383 RepID=UPI001C0B7AEA|nr:dihydrofolate reductase [Polynucleobacter sp. Tro8-14-1]MBU3563918.1 dihydrofolate reductase [Polynucleobacter sp. Tro8-14-1]